MKKVEERRDCVIICELIFRFMECTRCITLINHNGTVPMEEPLESRTPASTTPARATAHARAAKQQRSVNALNAFISNGIKMLNGCRLNELRVPDLVKRCGCSVGNFYLRFPNKESYFKALQAEVMAQADILVVERLHPKQLAAMDAGAVLDSMVDLMADIFTSPGRGVYRESFLRIQEVDDPWAPMRLAGRDIMRRYIEGTADKFASFSAEQASQRLRFCFQTVVGVLQNDLVNDYHVHSARDGSVRQALKAMLKSYMAVTTTTRFAP